MQKKRLPERTECSASPVRMDTKLMVSTTHLTSSSDSWSELHNNLKTNHFTLPFDKIMLWTLVARLLIQLFKVIRHWSRNVLAWTILFSQFYVRLPCPLRSALNEHLNMKQVGDKKPLSIFTKSPIIHAWRGPKCVSSSRLFRNFQTSSFTFLGYFTFPFLFF